MIDIVTTYEAMQAAAKKAAFYKNQYSLFSEDAKRDAQALLRHKIPEQRTEKTYKFILKETKRNNMELQDAGDNYKHWRDEQIRLSNLLQGELAFKQLVKEIEDAGTACSSIS